MPKAQARSAATADPYRVTKQIASCCGGPSGLEQRLAPAGGVTFILGSSCILLGAVVLVGWATDADVLKRVVPGFVAMNPATAICVMVAGFALTLAGRRYRRAVTAAGSTVAMLGAAKMGDLLSGGLPIDQVLYAASLDGEGGSIANRMAPNTALALLLFGLAIATAGCRGRGARLGSQVLALSSMLVSMFALVGYAFGLHHLHSIGPFIPMALHTAIALLVLGLGTLALTSSTGIVLVLRDRGPAGSLARSVLPLAISIPVVVGAARLWGENHGYYGTEAGVALTVVGNVAVTSALIIYALLALYQSDRIRRRGEEALRESEFFNRIINRGNPDCVSLLDADGEVIFANDATARAYGLESSAELLGRPWGDRLDPASRRAAQAALDAAQGGAVGRLLLCLPSGESESRWFESLVSKVPDADGHRLQFMVMSRDITRQKNVEDEVRWSAAHDSMTGLPNRAAFQAQLEEAARTGDQDRFSVLLLDVDHFKQVNDALGHDAGDRLLQTIATRVRAAVRDEDLVARLGGDEFAIILHRVSTEEEVRWVADKIFQKLREPWCHNGLMADCRVSIGASIFGIHGSAPSELLKNADVALYAAKAQGRSQAAVFHAEMRAEMQRRASMLSVAKDALERDALIPYYQPKVDLTSGRINGFEALLRWRDLRGGIQPPASIAEAFHDLELAAEISDRIIGRVLADMQRWVDAGIEFGHVAINAAAADFRRGDYAQRLIERMQEKGLPGYRLQVEVTETVFLGRGADHVEQALRALSASGIRIALDDFGTGYASLSHLKQFPVDTVKIDRSFVRDIHDADNAAIVRAVVNLGRSLDLEVVAEGIETPAQEAYLLAQGCQSGQGYLYGRAVAARRVPAITRRTIGNERQAPPLPQLRLVSSS